MPGRSVHAGLTQDKGDHPDSCGPEGFIAPTSRSAICGLEGPHSVTLPSVIFVRAFGIADVDQIENVLVPAFGFADAAQTENVLLEA